MIREHRQRWARYMGAGRQSCGQTPGFFLNMGLHWAMTEDVHRRLRAHKYYTLLSHLDTQTALKNPLMRPRDRDEPWHKPTSPCARPKAHGETNPPGGWFKSNLQHVPFVALASPDSCNLQYTKLCCKPERGPLLLLNRVIHTAVLRADA